MTSAAGNAPGGPGKPAAPGTGAAASTSAQVRAWAKTRNLETWFEEETDSTNLRAKSENIMQPKLYLADRQTAGRGRGDHTWTTPKNALLSTWSFPLNFAPQPILSPLIGLALFEASQRGVEAEFNLKAPNDLFIGEKKVAGLLIETVIGANIKCAIGLGFNAGEAPAINTATGLAPRQMNWPAFLDAFFDQTKRALEIAKQSQIPDDERRRLKQALNLHPLLKETVLNVGPLGQIQTPTKLINWHEL